MRFSIIFLSVFIYNCHGFLFDKCQTNADCPNGCCVAGTFSYSCHTNYLALHHSCHLSGHETTSCGCAHGLVCVPTSSSSHVIGHCEHAITVVTSTSEIPTSS